MAKAVRLAAWTLCLTPVLYFTACSIVSNHRDQGFARVRLGDNEVRVIAAMGKPSDREAAGSVGHNHGAASCSAPCAQRLWYLNNLSLAGEAWFVDLGESGQVVDTARLVSP